MTIAAFANTARLKRAAVLYENNSYGRGLAENFRKSFAGTDHQHRSDRRGRRSELRSVRELVQAREARRGLRRRHRRARAWRFSKKRAVSSSTPSSSAATDGRRSRRARSPKASMSVRRSARRIRVPKCRRSSPRISKKFNATPDGNAALAYDATKLLARSRRKRRARPREDSRLPRRPHRGDGVSRRHRHDPLSPRRRSDRKGIRDDARASGRASGGERANEHASNACGLNTDPRPALARLRHSRRAAAHRRRRRAHVVHRHVDDDHRVARRSADRSRSSRASCRRTPRRPSKPAHAISRRATPPRETPFANIGWAAHDVQRKMNDRPGPVGGRSRDRRGDRQHDVGHGSRTMRSRIGSPTSVAGTTPHAAQRQPGARIGRRAAQRHRAARHAQVAEGRRRRACSSPPRPSAVDAVPARA